MTGRQWTLLGLGVSGVILSAFEVRALITREEGDTISARAHDAIIDYPVVAGLLVAPVVHFCTPTRSPREAIPWWQGPSIALIGGGLLGLSWIRRDPSRRPGDVIRVEVRSK